MKEIRIIYKCNLSISSRVKLLGFAESKAMMPLNFVVKRKAKLH